MVERILHLVAHVHVMSYPFWTAANLTDGAVTVQKVRLEGAHKHHPIMSLIQAFLPILFFSHHSH